MKSEISDFMAMKSAFMGFFKVFSWDFHEKDIHSENLTSFRTCIPVAGDRPILLAMS